MLLDPKIKSLFKSEYAVKMLIAEKLIKQKQKERKMDNVKFFDKNGVELKVGDCVVAFGNKLTIRCFDMEFGHGEINPMIIAHFIETTVNFQLRTLTKHTPKLVKIKRTFEEVCELVKQECLFKYKKTDSISFNVKIGNTTDGNVFVDGYLVKDFLFKHKNSDTWQELEYKEVEE